MKNTKRNWLLTGIIAFVITLGSMIGFGINKQVHVAYAATKITSSSTTWGMGASDYIFDDDITIMDPVELNGAYVSLIDGYRMAKTMGNI